MKFIFMYGAPLGLLGAVPLFAGCESDASPAEQISNPPPSPGPDGGAANADGGLDANSNEPPLYFISTSIPTGESTFTYLDVVDRFDDSLATSFDATKGIEVAGWASATVELGAGFVADANAPTVTRYDVTADRKLAAGKTLSFAGLGVSSVHVGQLAFVSAEKAYFIDIEGERAIVWNPTTMELVGKEISLAPAHRPDLLLDVSAFASARRLRGSELFLPVSWADVDYISQKAMGIVVLDVQTDTFKTVFSDDRCGDTSLAVDSPAGDTYYFPSLGAALSLYLEPTAPRPHMCSLRVLKDQKEFDKSYLLDLTTLVGGNATAGGGAQGAIADGKTGFFFTAADDARFADRENNGGFYNKLWHYDFSTSQAKVVDGAPWWGSAAMYRHAKMDGKLFAVSGGPDAAGAYTTTVFQLDPQNVTTFTVKGWIDGFGKLR